MTLYKKLYSTDSKGNVREWELNLVIKDSIPTIVVTHGLQNGKKAVSEKQITSGKNIGRANETTPYEQSVVEAQSKINAQIKKGYSETVKTTTGGKVNMFPMLALQFRNRKHDIKYPAYLQPKLNGARALFRNNEFYSRKNTKFNHLEPLKNFSKKPFPSNYVWDGELYSHDNDFAEILSAIRKEKTKPDLNAIKKLKFNVYDMIDMKRPNLPLKERLEIVKEYIKPESVVRTDTIHSEKDVYDKHKHYTGIGYEGVMIRNIDSPYTLKHRSKNLQKYKTFLDDEYPVIDFKEGTGKDKGTIIFIMKSHTGKIFNCRPRGTAEARAKAYKNGKSYIGKKITVTYQELTAGGTPVFPVCALTPRDYE